MIRLTGCTIPTNSPHAQHDEHSGQAHFFDHAAGCLEHQFLHFFGTVDINASVVVAGSIAVVSLVSLIELAPVLDFML